MKFIPGHVKNINGITPTESIALVSEAERMRINTGLMRVTPAQLAIESTIQLRVFPVHEKYMPKLTIREHKRVSEFARWFMTLGRATPILINTENIDTIECSRHDDAYNSRYRKVTMANSGYWFDDNWNENTRLTRTNPPIRATLQLDTIATVPEYDDIAIHVKTGHLMLNAPQSPQEKSGSYGFNMVYMEEI